MNAGARRLRVAFLAGTLAPGGAETQLTYMVRALRAAGVDVRVYCLASGEFFEHELTQVGVRPVWVGRQAHPLLRTAAFVRALWDFRPHFIQAAHFYTNLYIGAAARITNAIGIGTLRSDAYYDVASNGRWGRWLLRVPETILTNSYTGKRNAETLGLDGGTVHVVPNVIDLPRFDSLASEGNGAGLRDGGGTVVMSVASQVPVKRLECFLAALALARSLAPMVSGVLVGDGTERERLEAVARDLGLTPDGVQFLGQRSDVPALLRRADMLLVTSQHEGFPNVVLEAMASRLPVITTPAGDAALVVQDSVTGYVVPFDDVGQMAERIVQLAAAPQLRRDLGGAGRRRAEACYGVDRLAGALLDCFRAIAQRSGHHRASALIP